MIRPTLKLTKDSFFDRAAVIAAMDRVTHRALSRSGAIVRREARSSIKDRPRQKLKEMTPEEQSKYRASVAAAEREGRPKPKRPMVTESSKPGKPPYSITNLLRGKTADKRAGITFDYDFRTRSVVVGPIKLNTSSGAPAVLEHGGTTTIRTRRKSRKVRVAARPYMGPALARILAQGKIPDAFRERVQHGKPTGAG
ncbi:MAG TPA: hypothetical protein PKC43_06260 [Phycisphaerales bacterium]|nr:hypothetical protein [Phycisphaerales bacterium]HMP37035.1 hypothetical protein [Phycisphaerales bacterium]